MKQLDQIEIIATKSSNVFSRIILFFTKEPVSHIAVVWGNLIFQSNLVGVNVNWLNAFLKKNRVVYRIRLSEEFKIILEKELESIVDQFSGSGYDWKALVSEPIRLFSQKHLKTQVGLDDPNAFLCTELCYKLDSAIRNNTADQRGLFKSKFAVIPLTPWQILDALGNDVVIEKNFLESKELMRPIKKFDYV